MTVYLLWSNRCIADNTIVYRSTAPFDAGSLPAALATLSGSAQSYADTTASFGTQYFYRIGAKLGSKIVLSDMFEIVGAGVYVIPYPQITATITATGSVGTHRYWRFASLTGGNDGNAGSIGYLGIAEIEMHTSVGGADVTGSGTASASSYRAGLEPYRAFDNNVTTKWSSNGQIVGDWLAYDFGVGVAYEIVEVKMTARNDGFQNQMMLDFVVEFSDDGTNWTPYWAVLGQSAYSSGETRTFACPTLGAATYWALIARAGGNASTGYYSMSEIELRDTVAGSNLSLTGTASAFSADATLTAAKLNDGITGSSNGWRNGIKFASTSTSNHHLEWLRLQLASAKSIGYAIITARDAGQAVEMITDLDMAKSSDGTQFRVTSYARGVSAYSDGETRYLLTA